MHAYNTKSPGFFNYDEISMFDIRLFYEVANEIRNNIKDNKIEIGTGVVAINLSLLKKYPSKEGYVISQVEADLKRGKVVCVYKCDKDQFSLFLENFDGYNNKFFPLKFVNNPIHFMDKN